MLLGTTTLNSRASGPCAPWTSPLLAGTLSRPSTSPWRWRRTHRLKQRLCCHNRPPWIWSATLSCGAHWRVHTGTSRVLSLPLTSQATQVRWYIRLRTIGHTWEVLRFIGLPDLWDPFGNNIRTPLKYIFFWGMTYFSGVRILPKGSHKSGGAINRNRKVTCLFLAFRHTLGKCSPVSSICTHGVLGGW